MGFEMEMVEAREMFEEKRPQQGRGTETCRRKSREREEGLGSLARLALLPNRKDYVMGEEGRINNN